MGKGLENPWGSRVRVRSVRVRVQILRPLTNPYPSAGVKGLLEGSGVFRIFYFSECQSIVHTYK
jgi:hypothetical protein